MEYIANVDRYSKMKYQRSGESGLLLPIISLGMWHNFGKGFDFDNMKEMLKTAFDNGITHFDLANNYGFPYVGSAEENVGKILKNEFDKHRDELIISTKAGYKMWDGPYGDFGSRKYLISSLDQSLCRLGLDYVDIFYHHRPDPNTPIEETMLALSQIVNSGKALYIGLSNYNGEQMQKASAILKELKCPFIINQNRYSILDRTVEKNGILEAVKTNKKGMICYSPLAQGLLSDKYLNGIPENSRIKTSGIYLKEESLSNETLKKIKELNEIAKNRGETLAQMALVWLLSHDEITSVLIGASSKEQIIENVKIVDRVKLSKDELELIDKISK